MSNDRVMKYIFFLEIGGFLVLALAIWVDELFNLPHYLFGLPPIPINYHEAVFESGFVILLGFGIMFYTWRLTKRITTLEKLVPICMFCKRIRSYDADPEKQESWKPLELYINERTGSRFSHGLCPECAMKHYGDVLREK